MDYQVICYCGGKTGSTSLHLSFLNIGLKSIHVHSNEEYKKTHKILAKKFLTLPLFINVQKSKDVYIIDSYRNPIERSISSFFENIEKIIGEDYISIDNSILMYYFNKFLLHGIENYHPLDIEMPILSDVNFDFENKYCLKKCRNKTYIKLRFKDINNWTNILYNIIGRKINLLNSNNGDIVNPGYKLFKSQYILPKSYLLSLNSDNIFHKYNNAEEIEEYKSMWELKSEEDSSLFNKPLLFKKIPIDFDVNSYIRNNPYILENYTSENEIKIHYELFGYKKGLTYK